MQLMTEYLPSGYEYPFASIKIMPMKFAEILEYVENVPKNEVDKFYFDYCVLKADDPNVDNLLLPDLEYVIFMKKAITLSKESSFIVTIDCPECHNKFRQRITIPNDVKYSRIDKQFINGIQVEVNGEIHSVKVPTVTEFMRVFSNYHRLKNITDMKIIKLIALFQSATVLPNKYENLVTQATYDDITLMTMLSQLFYEIVEPVKVYCPSCNREITNPNEKRGMVVEINSLITDFFRDVIINNGLTESKIILREVRQLS